MLSLAPAVASATGQSGDVIYIDGKAWGLMGRPLDRLDSVRFADFYSRLPENRTRSTANWGGYTCYWSLQGEWLVLDSVMYEVWDSVYVKAYNSDRDSVWASEERSLTLPRAIILETLKDYCRDGKIVATWYTDTVRAVQGELIFYEHSGYNRFFDTEIVLELKNGHADKRTLHHNRVLVDGFDFEGDHPEQWRDFRDGFLQILRKYPELDTVERIVFTLRYGVVDSLGNLLDIQVKTESKREHDLFSELIEQELEWEEIQARLEQEREKSSSPELERAFKEYLVNIRPWKVWLVNGEYFTPLKWGALVPFYLKE